MDDRIRRRRLYEEVEEHLEREIRDQYQEGDLLPPERALMERFGVGRPAVREALFSLQKKGLVSVGSGERPRVTRPTPKAVVAELASAAQHLLAQPGGVRHFQEVRMALETGIARIAAMRATSDHIARLEAALTANKAALGNAKDFERTDVEFHHCLAAATNNPIFTAVHEAVVSWLTNQRTQALRNPHADEIAYSFHERIFNAVSVGDGAAAESIMRNHLEKVIEQYWRAD